MDDLNKSLRSHGLFPEHRSPDLIGIYSTSHYGRCQLDNQSAAKILARSSGLSDACQPACSGDIEDCITELAALKTRVRALESRISGKVPEETKSLESWQWLRRAVDP